MTDPNLIKLIQQGEIEKVRTLLDQDPSLATSKDENGVSALMISIYYGQQEISELLHASIPRLDFFESCALGDVTALESALRKTPNLLNASSPDGFSGLGFAAFFGHLSITQRLLEFGAQPDNPSTNGLAVTPLGSAAAGNHIKIASELLKVGANPNAQQNGGFSPLHSACQNGSVEMVELLLNSGAIVDLQTSEWKTASDLCDGPNTPMIRSLLSGH